MRSIRFETHPLSALTGAAGLALVLLATSASQTHPGPQRVTIVGPVSISGEYDPRDAVVVREGAPFTVPTGKLFVLTGLGRVSGSGSSAALKINGATELRTYNGSGNDPTEPTVRPLPPGLTANAGDVVDVDNGASGSDGRAWGYLVDA